MKEFNRIDPIGSIFEYRKQDKTSSGKEKLVDFIFYCLNPNHFHFCVIQNVEGGISEFMKRIGGGYTNYFNERHKRNGSLFQGTFKAVHVKDNTQLLHLSAYVNLNNEFGSTTLILSKSSWTEYIGKNNENFCSKSLILDQFATRKKYQEFALSSREDIIERKKREEN